MIANFRNEGSLDAPDGRVVSSGIAPDETPQTNLDNSLSSEPAITSYTRHIPVHYVASTRVIHPVLAGPFLAITAT